MACIHINNGINQLISGITRLMNGITRLINGLARLIKWLVARPGPQGRRGGRGWRRMPLLNRLMHLINNTINSTRHTLIHINASN